MSPVALGGAASGATRVSEMAAYILRRILLIIPTMFGIMLVTFVIVQFAPGGPVERLIAQLTGTDPGATSMISGGGGDATGPRPGQGGMPGDVSAPSKYRGAQGLDPEFIKSLEKQFGFDKPAYVRFAMMIIELSPVRFRPELFPRYQRAEADRRADAGLDLARPMDDASVLRHLHSARHSQGGARRIALRRMDQYGDRDWLCHSRASSSPCS